MSKLTPEQFKEIKPFLETSVSYHAVSRDGKVAFAVDKENAPAFHRAFENAMREVGMLRNMSDLGLPMEHMIALSPVIHRLAVEDMKLNLADFFDKRYDEAQFGEMLSLVNAYLSQAPAERYGENSKLNDMLEAKSSFDRAIELFDFFSQHNFSDEQRAAITAMFVGDVTRGQINSIDETFTAEDIQAYDEILHNALQESDVADFLTAHKQAVIDRENAARVPTEEEALFPKADLAMFLAVRTLSSDEWESMAYPMFENGYIDKFKPSDKAILGYHLSEPALYDLAHRYHNDEDIRRELALGLLEGGNSADIEFVFEDGKISDRTFYYAENLRHSLHTERTEDGYKCSFGGMERFVSFEEIGQAFIDRTHEEFEDLMYWRVLDYIRDDIPDIADDTVHQLITAFDGAALPDWEKGDNQPKINRIKKALFDILGDEEQTEKAFACIAKQKYNVNFEAEKPERSIHFGLLGNGITAYDVSRTDKETNDYPIVAHISPEGVVRIYDNSISAEDMERINEQARLAREKFMAEWDSLDTATRFQRLYDRADISTTVNIGKEKLSMEEKIEKYMPFVFFGEGERPEPEAEKKVKGTYKIYQLPEGEKYHGIRFESKETLEKEGVQLNHEDYELVYEGEIDDFKGNATLEALFTQFNTAHPSDFTGHSLSVSDVIVTSIDGEEKAYYCDDMGFTEMPAFYRENEIGLKDIVERFFSEDSSVIETPDSEWRIANGGYDLVAEIYHNNTPVCGIINAVGGYEVSAYQGDKDVVQTVTDVLKSRGIEVIDIADEHTEEVLDGTAEQDKPSVEINPPKRDVPEKTVDLMSDISEGAENAPEKAVNPLTIVFNGDSDSLNKIKDKALSLGATCTLLASGLMVDTYENHRDELISAAYELGLKSKIRGEEIPDISIDDDTPLFSDADVIDEIQKNENSDVPFWDMPEMQGEQLSQFDDPEPVIIKPKKSAPKEEYQQTIFVGDVNRFAALHDEIMRGTGFQNGKFRVKQFYDEKKPTNKEFADFLKNEYGTGGHTGDGEIGFVDHDSKGMFFTLESGEKFKFTWSDVAEMTSAIIDKGEYITQDDIDRRIKHEKYANENTNSDSTLDTGNEPAKDDKPTMIEVGDKFRNKMTGEISEVISLTGALPWNTEDCTVRRESSGFAIEENISYSTLFDTEKYEYLGKGEVPEKSKVSEKTAEQKAPVTADAKQAAEMPKPKNLSQLKKALQVGMEFEILEHHRPERVGERRVVTGKNTANFTSKRLDENNQPYGDDIYMDWDRAANWRFDGDKITAMMSGVGDTVLLSFKFIDGKEHEKTAEVLEPELAVDNVKTEDISEKVGNFTITDDALGEGGAKAKFGANVEAIRTLKKIESANLKLAADMFRPRSATAEEKEILSKYVGWGSLAKAFDKSDPKWSAEYQELSELLTPEEYRQARASVNDAFYTSPTIIDGIYEALRNFGFEGGNVLDIAVTRLIQ